MTLAPNYNDTNLRPQQLTFPKPSDLFLPNSRVLIIHYDPLTIGRVFALGIRDDNFLPLLEAICDCVDDPKQLTSMPPIGSIILAKCPVKIPQVDNYPLGQHFRGIISKIDSIDTNDPNVALVFFKDLGIKALVKLPNMIQASREVLGIKVMGQWVKLKGIKINKEERMFYSSDLKKLMDEVMSDSCVVMKGPEATPEGTISLEVKYGSKRANLAQLILQLQIWEWERCFITRNSQNQRFLKFYENKRLEFKDLVQGFKTYESREERDEDWGVWERQVKKYTEKIPYKEGSYYPQVMEPFLLWIDPEVKVKVKGFEGMEGVGRWNRCYKNDFEWIRNLDLKEVYPVDGKNKYKYVPAMKDFWTIPFENLEVGSLAKDEDKELSDL